MKNKTCVMLGKHAISKGSVRFLFANPKVVLRAEDPLQKKVENRSSSTRDAYAHTERGIEPPQTPLKSQRMQERQTQSGCKL